MRLQISLAASNISFLRQFADSEAFNFCRRQSRSPFSSSFEDKLIEYVRTAMRKMNKYLFNDALNLQNVEYSFSPKYAVENAYAYWNFEIRGYWFSPNSFSIFKELGFLAVVLHEMCHQAVSDLDKIPFSFETVHGKEWKAWMRRVGLPVHPTSVEYHFEKEYAAIQFAHRREARQRQKAIREDLREYTEKVNLVKGRRVQLKVTPKMKDVPVQVYDPNLKKWAPALIAGIFDKSMFLVTSPRKKKLVAVHITNPVFVLPQKEANKITTDIWLKKAEAVRQQAYAVMKPYMKPK